MSTTVQVPRARSRPPRPPSRPLEQPSRRQVPWAASLASGVAVLLAAGPLTAVVQGVGWLGHAAVVVAAVAGVGPLLHRFGAVAVAAGQCGAVLLVLTLFFSDEALLGVLPGPATMGEFGTLLAGAGQQIDSGTAPIPATPEILFLVTAAFGVLAIAVYIAAVALDAPAAAGVPLLAVFAVPAALADDLLPWWAMAAAAAGFGVLLIARTGIRRQLQGGVALVAGAVVVALVVGAGAGFVGTEGRFTGGGGAGGTGGAIGLTPFTSLRGQLNQTEPVQLFEVRGLARPTYMRVLTLRQYVPDTGWQATRPAPGVQLPGRVQPQPLVPGEVADIRITNVGYRDYWLPLYGEPLDVGGELTPDLWLYDIASGTGYTGRPREEDEWQLQALLPQPTVQQLRAAEGIEGAGLEYLDTTGVDPRVADIAQQVVAGRPTGFDRALALLDYFTGPDSAFTYSLQTAPGTGDDALVEFLTVGRQGYCEQFASAMAVMLRTVGIPARVAVGFTGGVDVGDYRSISTADAHAWVEAWFPGIGWTPLDPTPLTDGRTIEPPYVQDARAEQAAQAPPVEEPAPADEPLNDAPAAAPEAPEATLSQPTDPATQQDAGLPLWPFAVALLTVAAALVPALLRARQRRRRLAAVAAGGPGAAVAGWSELLAESSDRGADSAPSDTVRAAARRLVREHRLDRDAQQSLRQLVSAVEASWYGGAHPKPGELSEPVRTVAAGITAGSRLSLRGRLLPRSVMRRLRRRQPESPNPREVNASSASSV